MTKKVTIKIIREWIADLESGMFTQGKGHLCYIPESGPPKYCCLGILCELLGVRATISPWSSTVAYDGLTSLPDHGIALQTDSFFKPGGISCYDLAHMNDGTGGYRQRTFPEIAEVIKGALLDKYKTRELV